MLGDLSLRQGDTTGARQQLARAAAELTRLGDPVAAAAALGDRATLEAAAACLPPPSRSFVPRSLRSATG